VSGVIGYYVHHQGEGHYRRAQRLARALPDRIVLLGAGLAARRPDTPFVDLPDDRLDGDRPAGGGSSDERPEAGAFDGADRAGRRPSAVHYAPLHHAGVRRRNALVTDWIDRMRPDLFISDVSVEMALLARLSATPTACVRLNGDRSDPAHAQAFAWALATIAPFHPDLEDASTPASVRAETLYMPGLAPRPAAAPVDPRRIVVVFGGGGGRADVRALAEAARATPVWTWSVLGPTEGASRDLPPNLQLEGWVADAETRIASAALVVGSAGDGVVEAVLAAGRPFVCLPQARPYGEQQSKAERLKAAGAALRLDAWPAAAAWPVLIDRALALDPSVAARLHPSDGLTQAVRALESLAARAAPPPIARPATGFATGLATGPST
jgi:hypothetical protein